MYLNHVHDLPPFFWRRVKRSIDRLRLELGRAEMAESGMATLPIVPDLDVVKDIGSGLCSCPIPPILHPFPLQCREKALHHGTIPAISFAAHAARDAGFLKHLLIFFARILAAPIGMVKGRPAL